MLCVVMHASPWKAKVNAQKMNDLRENNVAKVDMKMNFDELNKCNNYSKGEWAKEASA